MSRPGAFLDVLRRHVRRAYFRSAIWQSVFALCIATLLPWLLIVSDTTDGPVGRYSAVALEMLGGVTWLYFIFRNAIRRRTPGGDPVNIQLAMHGLPEAVAGELNLEFTGQPYRARRIYVGKKWLCYAWKKQVTVLRTDALVWAYLENVRQSVNLIPTGTTHQLVAWTREGQGAAMPGEPKQDLEPALLALRQAAPWMFFGYTELLKESWNSDRADFIALVDAEREKGSHKGTEAEAPSPPLLTRPGDRV